MCTVLSRRPRTPEDLSPEAEVFRWIPTLTCANPTCMQGKYMPLPYEGSGSRYPHWPVMDWRAFIVCRFCERGQIYGRKDIRWLLTQTASALRLRDELLVQIELKCCEPCSAPMLVHTFSDDRWNPNATLMQLSRMEGSPRCPNGHWMKAPVQIEAARSLRDFREASLSVPEL